MQKNQGFSLTEVLVSIFLVASISLLLLKQQWQISQQVQKVISKFDVLIQTDNNQELKQRGFGILELLISLLLANLLMGCLIQQYIQVKRQFNLAQLRIEQARDLQLAAELIRNSVRNAGFTPCMALKHLKTFDARNNKTNISAVFIEDNNLYINRMSGNFAVSQQMEVDRQHIKLSNKVKFKNQITLLIADCYNAEVQNANVIYKNNNEQTIRLQRPLHFRYQPPIYVGDWLEESYFIKKNKRGNKSLNYKLHDTNELTNLIDDMSVNIQQILGFMVVNVIFSMTDNSIKKLSTRIRNK